VKVTIVIFDNPFFQRPTIRQKGCQIDFLIQTKFKTVYVLEIKFYNDTIGKQIITEVQEKIQRISLPQGTAIFPVLVHVNGVADSVMEADYFYAIIDFNQLLRE